MSEQIFVTVTQCVSTKSTLLGPFASVSEAKRKVTDVVDLEMIDTAMANDVSYTFHQVTSCPVDNLEVGYVLFYVDYEISGLETKSSVDRFRITKRSEHFPDHDVTTK